MNYYELLGIDSNASAEDIKRAYKTQMKKWHPDINKDSEAVSMSMKINEAKDILLDENKRKEYDVFLKQKEEKIYQRYSSPKSNYSDVNHPEYSSKMVTKWEYFKEYLNSENIGLFKKVVSSILVGFESLFCFLIKWFIILLAFICFYLGDIIFMVFYYIFPVVVILLGYIIYLLAVNGLSDLFSNHLIAFRCFIVIIITFLSSFGFVFIGKKLISQRVFNFLYNKLDIYLFKKSIFYGQSKY